MMNGNSNFEPSALGIQYPGAIPCGKKIPVNRSFGFASALPRFDCAGNIDSSSGKARVTPAPRRKVRRGMCFFEINMTLCLLVLMGARSFANLVFSEFHVALECGASDDAQHQ